MAVLKIGHCCTLGSNVKDELSSIQWEIIIVILFFQAGVVDDWGVISV